MNGSYKSLFPVEKFTYTGLDMAPGRNVDICPANPYFWEELASDSFDIVISGQAFEHIEFFWLTAAEMARILKPGGFMCLIAPRGFGRHRHPVDCYRFDADGMVAIARWCNFHVLHVSTNLAPAGAEPVWRSANNHDSMLVATKPFDWHGPLNAMHYKFQAPDIDRLAYPLI